LAFDLQIVAPQEAIPISQVIPLEGSDPAKVIVIGSDFTAVDEVYINEVETKNFSVLGTNQLVAELPLSVKSGTVTTVSVLSRRLVLTEESQLRFKLSRVPGKATGVLRLIQLFIKILLATPGSDIFSPGLGGGLLRSVGRSFSKNSYGAIVSDAVVCVDLTKRQIITLQSTQGGLPASEKLLEARVSKATYDANQSAMRLTIELTSQAGRSALANLVL